MITTITVRSCDVCKTAIPPEGQRLSVTLRYYRWSLALDVCWECSQEPIVTLHEVARLRLPDSYDMRVEP